MQIELMHSVIGVMFVAVWILAGDIAIADQSRRRA